MSAEFAEYQPDRGPRPNGPEAEYVLRPLRDADVEQVGSIISARQRITPDAGLAWAQKEADRMREEPDLHRVLVACGGDRILGYAKVLYFTPPPDAPANVAPAGWHLGGVVVRPSQRRRGVATALVRARLEWLEGRDRVAWYFANESNRPTIDLHAPFGFREVTRDFWVPGVSFSGGGSGVLFRAEAPWRA